VKDPQPSGAPVGRPTEPGAVGRPRFERHDDGHARLALGPLSARLHRRSAWVGGLLAALVLAAVVVALILPGAGVETREALGVLFGGGDGFAATVVLNWRLPRVLAAVLVGAALALSGAIFQSLTRNPLGSPDVIGFNTGAYTGAILVTLGGVTGFAAIASGAFVGGLLTALVVYLLSLRAGSSGLRMVVVGLGVAAMLGALNRWLIAVGDLELSMQAAAWGAGSLNGLRWAQVTPVAIALLVFIAAAFLVARRMQPLDLGDDAAAGLGLRLGPTRLLLLAVGVALTAVSTAIAGPISFVALAAPHIARRITRASRVSPLPVALTGALIVVVADIVAQRLFDPTQLPVGIVTVTLGGLYLITLLAKEARR
jgi:iron complex transport system permease protein